MSDCQNVTVTIQDQYTAEVSTTNAFAEVPFKELVIDINSPTTTLQDDLLVGQTPKSTMVLDGVVVVWAKYGITFNSTTGTFDTSAYGSVTNQAIIEYK